MAEALETKVVRIVNLGDSFTPATLEDFIKQRVSLEGPIQKVYIRTYVKTQQLVYAYIIFDKGVDALKVVTSMNKYTHENYKFDVALIGPDLPYNQYSEDSIRRSLKESMFRRKFPSSIERLRHSPSDIIARSSSPQNREREIEIKRERDQHEKFERRGLDR